MSFSEMTFGEIPFGKGWFHLQLSANPTFKRKFRAVGEKKIET